MSLKYVNAAVFITWSLTYHNSRHINTERDTAHCETDLQEHKFTNFYQMDQLWWELYSRECGEGLTDVKIEGADIQKV